MLMNEYLCERESWGYYTNLQLCALREAWRLWKELEANQAQTQQYHPNRAREQCVVIINLLGLSVSQLLGQNAGLKKEDSVWGPSKLLEKVLDRLSVGKVLRDRLTAEFGKFIEDYDGCRHFGPQKHDRVTRITLESTRMHLDLCLEIWDTICVHHSADFEGIREVVDGLASGRTDYDPPLVQ